MDSRLGREAVRGATRWRLLFVMFVVGCGSSPPGHPSELLDDEWLGPADELGRSPSDLPAGMEARAEPDKRTRGAADPAGAPTGSDGSRAGEMAPPNELPGSEPARPPRRRVVNIELRDAPLDEVLRFLADAGGFGLVLEPSAVPPVHVSLHLVEPFEALVSLAESNGLQVRYLNGVVVVAPNR